MIPILSMKRLPGRPLALLAFFQMEPSVYGETGICLGPDYTGKGLWKADRGRGLWITAGKKLHAKTFVYASRSENQGVYTPLALRLGFTQTAAQELIDGDTGKNLS